MTTSDWKKMFKQLKKKPVKLKKYIKFNAPKKRTTGRGKNKCYRCGRHAAHISKYSLNICRTCFREVAKNIGFRRYS
jgi:small subunit ribosomal protein S14